MNTLARTLVVRRNHPFEAVKIFSATLFADRQRLGERVTEWISTNDVDVIEFVVSQSSDSSYHCLTISVFYADHRAAA